MIVVGLIVAAFVAWYVYEKQNRPAVPMPGGLHADITLPHTQEWELYHNSFSLCSKKLRVCMAELGLDYANHEIDLIETGSYENVSRRFLAVNPGGIVPVLVHNGHPVYESHDEIVYAAQHAGERGRQLLPEDPELYSIVEHWIEVASLKGNDPLQGSEVRAGNCIPALTLPIFATTIRYIPYLRILAGLPFHPYKIRPLMFLGLKFKGLAGLPSIGPVMKLLPRSRSNMHKHLDALAEHLEKNGGPWIAGERFTLADVSWVVILDRLVEADWEDAFWGQDQRPALAEYWERLKARPSYEAAIKKQRCDIVVSGMRDLRDAKRASPELQQALEEAG